MWKAITIRRWQGSTIMKIVTPALLYLSRSLLYLIMYPIRILMCLIMYLIRILLYLIRNNMRLINVSTIINSRRTGLAVEVGSGHECRLV
jgi:hypothetical protein